MESVRGNDARDLAEHLLRTYFRTQDYPFTRHHIESYDQFLSQDLPAIVKAANPITMLQDQIGSTGVYAYKTEIFIGGLDGTHIYVGTPTVSLKDSEEVRVLYPNEARLRNLTYAGSVEADLVIRVTFAKPNPSGGQPITTEVVMDPTADPTTYGYLSRFPLCQIPIMLHSRFCLLHGKPQEFLREAGECQYDYGGYFIVNGSEKVLVTHQEAAFNVLYASLQEREPKVELYASISCLNPTTRQVKRVAFGFLRRQNVLQVSLPFVRKPIPVFVLFRAMGVQSDKDILEMIFPDMDSAEAKILMPHLHESMLEAYPFLDTYSAIQYIKTMTKGFSEAHVLDILHNQTFIHVENRPGARVAFLAECVRKILRVKARIDPKTDRDDTRNQRCLTSGILTRMLFQGIYSGWLKAVTLTFDREYKNNKGTYQDQAFLNLFIQGTLNHMFKRGQMTESIMRAFKGKWSSGSGAGVGEEKTGVIQALSRLSYLDFLSHCRRVVLDFDTGMKAPEPRRLHTSQYGYFCTSETPCGGSIGITKNMSYLTAISTTTNPGPVIEWLLTRGGVMSCDSMTAVTRAISVPVFVNNGIIGYTLRPTALRDVLKGMKWTGCLPASASIGFSIRDRRVFLYLDEGRPMRPLIHLGPQGSVPIAALRAGKSWRDLVLGVLPQTITRGVYQTGFVDPLASDADPTLEKYMELLRPNTGVIEYMDPYEMNEAFIANFPEYIQPETSHMEIHPSTIVGLMTGMIPFAQHNQSPRNQLSCSQSKQGLSVYATNFQNRFDNQVHVLCYGQAPIVRTMYYDYVADGQIGYGHNLILAIGSFTGYNQDDGILMNGDSFARGMFRSTCYRSYDVFEEDDGQVKTRIGNPAKIPGWTSLKPGVDYSKLDDRGIVRVGEMVDETTVLVGRYIQAAGGEMKDASQTAQVWTRGRVEKVVTTVNNKGLALVKIRVVQERIPELGDKFSNRHGQKGTIGMFLRGHDMPRTKEGIPVDMIMNPHAIPSRMTVAQLIESLVGKAAPALGTIGNGTIFMNDGNPVEAIGKVLRDLGMDSMGEELMYDGQSGQMIPSQVFVGNVYTMRLKHMPEDKWNARGAGRREQRTRQPTGGRGAQGGLRIGEMERDAISGHGIMSFVQESYMKRADGYETIICNGCGTIPIYNDRESLYMCPLCDGPVRFIGETATNLEPVPPIKRSLTTFSKVEIPYAMKLLDNELNTYLNIGMRFLTDKDLKSFRQPPLQELTADQERELLAAPLPQRVLPETGAPEMIEQAEAPEVRLEDLAALGAIDAGENALPEEELSSGPANLVAPALLAPSLNQGASLAPSLSGVPPPGNNIPLVVVQPGAQQTVFNAPAALMNVSQPQGLEEVDVGTLPDSAPQAPPMALAPNMGVNVQTASQPVLVVPVNFGQQSGAELLPAAVPGAPQTLAVDTTAQGMNAVGLPALPPPPQRGGSRSRSVSPRGGMPSGGNVTVSKLGGGGGGATMNTPHVRVTVNKQG